MVYRQRIFQSKLVLSLGRALERRRPGPLFSNPSPPCPPRELRDASWLKIIISTLRLTIMEVEKTLFVKESSLARDHAIYFHVSESECIVFLGVQMM